MEKSHSLSHRRMSFRSFYFFFLIIFPKNISRGLKSTEHTHRFDKQNSISSFSSFSRRFSPSMQRTSSGMASTVECLFEHFFFSSFISLRANRNLIDRQIRRTSLIIANRFELSSKSRRLSSLCGTSECESLDSNSFACRAVDWPVRISIQFN